MELKHYENGNRTKVFTKALTKNACAICDWSGHYPRRDATVEGTLAIALSTLKMSLLIFQNSKRKFAFAACTITTA